MDLCTNTVISTNILLGKKSKLHRVTYNVVPTVLKITRNNLTYSVFYWDIYMHVTAQRGKDHKDLLQQIPVIISRWEEGVAVAKGY